MIEPPKAQTAGKGGEIVKRSLKLAGHRTSVSLEPIFWEELERLAGAQGLSLSKLVAAIDAVRSGNLSSALRVFVLKKLREGGSAPPCPPSP